MAPDVVTEEMYERVVQLRDMRMDEEEKLQDFYNAMQSLKREHDGYIRREKEIDEAILQTEKKIQQFQTDKQRKLNELYIVVPLKLDQIQNLVHGKLPMDVCSCSCPILCFYLFRELLSHLCIVAAPLPSL